MVVVVVVGVVGVGSVKGYAVYTTDDIHPYISASWGIVLHIRL